MAADLNRLSFTATAHCLTGCGIGEVLGLVIGTALGWGTVATIALAVGLAFLFGYSLTMLPLLRSGLPLASVLPIAFAADTISITVMEIVDNAVLLAIPGATADGARSGRDTGAWNRPSGLARVGPWCVLEAGADQRVQVPPG